MRQKLCQRQGITLVEVLVVVVILAALLAVALPSLLGQRNSAKDTKIRSEMTTLYRAIKSEYTSNGAIDLATLNRALASEPNVNISMAPSGTGITYPQNTILVSLVTNNAIYLAGQSKSNKNFLLVATPSDDNKDSYRKYSAPSSVGISPLTNLVPNPSWENDTTGYFLDSSASRSNDTASTGSYSIKIDTAGKVTPYTNNSIYQSVSLPIVSGQTYTASYRAQRTPGTTGTAYFRIDQTPAGVNSCQTISSIGAMPTTGWQTITCTFVATTNTIALRITSTSTGIYYVDDFAITPGSVAADFDGDSPGAWWNGTPHASTSSGYVGSNTW